MNRRIIRSLMAAAVIVSIGMIPINAEASIYVADDDCEFSLLRDDGVEDADYNVLFVGNSITYHPVADIWWGSWGMAASRPEKDYVHRVVAGLEEKHNSVDYDIIGYSVWERKEVRGKALPKIDDIIEKDYDLVVVQLGDNALDTSTFESDYEELVEYFKMKLPTARVILVGDFWGNGSRDVMKQNVADRQECTYVDISDIRTNKKDYRSFMGAVVYGDDGLTHEIDFPAVSVHPNDLANQGISQRILQQL